MKHPEIDCDAARRQVSSSALIKIASTDIYIIYCCYIILASISFHLIKIDGRLFNSLLPLNFGHPSKCR